MPYERANSSDPSSFHRNTFLEKQSFKVVNSFSEASYFQSAQITLLAQNTRPKRPIGSRTAIHIRLHPDNINSDSGIEIPEAWMPATIKKHNTGERYNSESN